MYLLVVYLAIIGFTCVSAEEVDQEALRECGNVHDIDVHSAVNSTGSFANEKCRLVCTFIGQHLPDKKLNEVFPCPADESGICHDGECVGNQKEAFEECSRLHNTTSEHLVNLTGSRFTPDHCALDCYIEGKLTSHNVRNQGQACGAGDGICSNGSCDIRDQTLPMTTPTLPISTVNPPSTHSPSNYQDIHNVEALSVTIRHAHFQFSDKGLYAIVCIVPSETNSLDECKQICRTDPVPVATTDPIWDHSCTLNVTSVDDVVRYALGYQGGVHLTTESDALGYLFRFFNNHNKTFASLTRGSNGLHFDYHFIFRH